MKYVSMLMAVLELFNINSNTGSGFFGREKGLAVAFVETLGLRGWSGRFLESHFVVRIPRWHDDSMKRVGL